MDLSLVFTFAVGLIASFIGSIVGGGGLITIPFFVFIGLPPEVAIATNKFGSLGLRFGALTRYWRAKKIIWEYVIPFSVIALVGAFIGASLLITINKQLLSKIVGYAILILLPLIVFKKEIGMQRIKIKRSRKFIGYFIYFLVTVWAGFFGGGAGTLFFYTLMVLFGVTIIEATATTKIPGILAAILALIIFAINGIINYLHGSVLLISMLIGGYAGAHTAVKKGDSWVKGLFIILVIASAIKLIFF